MDKEPFKYGKPVTGKYFVNRENELKQLYDLTLAIRSGAEVNIALVGLRRTGKTSLLKNLMEKLGNEKDIIVVFLDCYGIPSKNTFSKLLTEAVKDAYIEKSKDIGYKDRIVDLLKRKTSEVLSKASGMEVSIAHYLSIKIGFREKAGDLWEKSLGYAEKIGNEKDVYFAIMLDEFPDVAMRWGEDFVKRFRAVIQHQTRVMYILSGSAVSYMGELVSSKSSPFYRQLNTIKIEKLPSDIVKDFIMKRLNIIKTVLEKYVILTGGFPDYMQRLGHILFYKFGNSNITIRMLDEAYREMISSLESEFKETLNRLNSKSGVYGDIVLSLPYYSSLSEIARELNISQSSLPKYLNYLINIGIVKKGGRGKYMLSDPVFNNWAKTIEHSYLGSSALQYY